MSLNINKMSVKTSFIAVNCKLNKRLILCPDELVCNYYAMEI